MSFLSMDRHSIRLHGEFIHPNINFYFKWIVLPNPVVPRSIHDTATNPDNYQSQDLLQIWCRSASLVNEQSSNYQREWTLLLQIHQERHLLWPGVFLTREGCFLFWQNQVPLSVFLALIILAVYNILVGAFAWRMSNHVLYSSTLDIYIMPFVN